MHASLLVHGTMLGVVSRTKCKSWWKAACFLMLLIETDWNVRENLDAHWYANCTEISNDSAWVPESLYYPYYSVYLNRSVTPNNENPDQPALEGLYCLSIYQCIFCQFFDTSIVQIWQINFCLNFRIVNIMVGYSVSMSWVSRILEACIIIRPPSVTEISW